jgi:hypothetical protein
MGEISRTEVWAVKPPAKDVPDPSEYEARVFCNGRIFSRTSEWMNLLAKSTSLQTYSGRVHAGELVQFHGPSGHLAEVSAL